MPTTYLMHKTRNMVGVADLPEFTDLDEQPPRSFQIWWEGNAGYTLCSTSVVVPITKEIFDIMRGV